MRWALNGSVAMNGREREGWEGVEGLQEGLKGLSYTDEWALASNHRVPSLSNESEDATRKESTYKLIFTKRKGYIDRAIYRYTHRRVTVTGYYNFERLKLSACIHVLGRERVNHMFRITFPMRDN